MSRSPGPVAGATALAALLLAALAASPARGQHLLLSEFAVTPSAGEFVEIFNPTGETVDLSEYYLTDFVFLPPDETPPFDDPSNYWHLADRRLPGFGGDFMARFPDGARIRPGQSVVVCMADDADFSGYWGADARPDYELFEDGLADGVPSLVDAGPENGLGPLVNGSQFGMISNSREIVVLVRWDGTSDLMQDVDMVQWSNQGPFNPTGSNTISPNKTGIAIDGPDPGTDPSVYLADTPAQGQDLASSASPAHPFGLTASRRDYREGDETASGGNGITGHDETSENYSATWIAGSEASIGNPGPFGPPSPVSAGATSATGFEIAFSRGLDPASASSPGNFTVAKLADASGAIADEPLAVTAAELAADGIAVRLATGEQEPLALYEIRVSGLTSDDLGADVVPGTRVLARGFNPGPGLRLTVPLRPFVPHLDGEIEIAYEAPQGRDVLLRVFDTSGRELFVMAEEIAPAGGLRTLRWDGRDHLRQRLPAGVYYLHLELPATGDETVAPVVVAASSEEAIR